jgi:hypothetical protein
MAKTKQKKADKKAGKKSDKKKAGKKSAKNAEKKNAKKAGRPTVIEKAEQSAAALKTVSRLPDAPGQDRGSVQGPRCLVQDPCGCGQDRGGADDGDGHDPDPRCFVQDPCGCGQDRGGAQDRAGHDPDPRCLVQDPCGCGQDRGGHDPDPGRRAQEPGGAVRDRQAARPAGPLHDEPRRAGQSVGRKVTPACCGAVADPLTARPVRPRPYSAPARMDPPGLVRRTVRK